MGPQPRSLANIIIVGAGPSGLVLGLLLAKQGIPVTILDAAEDMNRNPRASHYSAPAIYELRRAGLMDEIGAKGFWPDGVSWRKMDGTRITGIHNTHVPIENRMVCLPLDRLIPIIVKHLENQPSANILFKHKVVRIGEDAEKAWVDVETPGGEKRFSAPYIVGCDGATSKIRRELFGDSFPGRTWDEQIVATNVYYPGLERFGWEDSNFIIDPEQYHMVAKIQADGLLRVTYGEISGLSREEYLKRQPMKFEQFLPGHPKPNEYNVVNISPYKIHQRCAKRFRGGRFLLAADAAHLCNPFGGLGLTGGLVDVGNLYDCLYGIHTNQADDSILDKYDEIRREKYNSIIDPVSSENLRRLWKPDDADIEKDQFFQMVKQAEDDEVFSRKMQMGLNAIMHDFTQYYQSPGHDLEVQTPRSGNTTGEILVSGEV